MLDPRIDKAALDDLWRRLGLDPEQVAQVRITPDGVHVQLYRLDKRGQRYLAGSGDIATQWMLIRYKDAG